MVRPVRGLLGTVSRMCSSKGFLVCAIVFGSPWMLWGLAAAGLPFAIRWLALRNRPATPFAPMEILRRATERRSLPKKLLEHVGPVLRACMLALVVVASARPHFFGSVAASPGVAPPTGHVLFLAPAASDARVAKGGTPPLMAAVMATTSLGCRLDALPSGPPSGAPDLRAALEQARSLVVCDGVIPDAGDQGDVAAFVERGGTAVFLFGPTSVAIPFARLAPLMRRLGGPSRLEACDARQTSVAGRSLGMAMEWVFGRDPGRSSPSPEAFEDFDDAFVALEGPRVRRFVPLDAVMEQGPADVIARLRSPDDLQAPAVAVLLRRGRGLVAFVGLPLELPGVVDDTWQTAETSAVWDDLAAWPDFIDVVRRVFVPILTAAPDSLGQGDVSRAGGWATPGVAGTLLMLAMVVASIDPLLALRVGERSVAWWSR